MKKIVAITLIIILSACNSINKQANTCTQGTIIAVQEVEKGKKSTIAKGAGIGAASGAGTGAVAGLTYGSLACASVAMFFWIGVPLCAAVITSSVATGGLIGAGVGTVAGAGTGYHLKKKKDQSSEENFVYTVKTYSNELFSAEKPKEFFKLNEEVTVILKDKKLIDMIPFTENFACPQN
ncbi:MAG: hypothetical protein J0H68_00460 [Sphingobacteriia bacterium]|nr:hypothetical protein [Sphingobacteriia bacterium]